MSELLLNTTSFWVAKEVKPWLLATFGMLGLLLVCLVAGQFDGRTLYGVSVWSKPSKFALSLAIYFATLIWIAPYIGREFFNRTIGQVLVWLPVVCAALEMAYIMLQASLGQPSHFNTSTAFHAAMYSLMGIGAVALVGVLILYALVIIHRNSMMDPMVLAIVLGLGMTFALGGGFGSYLGSSDGHWVNAPATDAGGSLFFGWSREGGDLRVAHFFGMHAMQAMPLFAYAIKAKWSALSKVVSVLVFAAVYSGFTVITFIQALAGHPFGVAL